MYLNSTSGSPEKMPSKAIITELIQFTREKGWGQEFHCIVPAGLGQPLINRCRVWLSRVKIKSKQHQHSIKHFKLGSRLAQQSGELSIVITSMDAKGQAVDITKTIPQDQEVATFYLYQTRIDRLADKADSILGELNQIDKEHV